MSHPAVPTPAIDPAGFNPFRLPARLWVPCPIDPVAAADSRPKPAGAKVSAGEPLVDGIGPDDPTPLAPVNGVIVGPSLACLCSGHEVPAIVLDVDSPEQPFESETGDIDGRSLVEQLNALSPSRLQEWIDRLRQLGVWSSRWSSPDLLGQLRQCRDRKPDTIVCNVLDADPSAGINRITAAAQANSVAAGVSALQRLTGAERAWVAVDDVLPQSTWEPLTAAGPNLRIIPIENHYPQVDPALLLMTLRRRRLKPGLLPTAVNAIVIDAATAATVGHAIVADQKVLQTPVALYDQPRDRTWLFNVPIGTRLGDLLDAVDLPRRGLDLRAGGPLREKHVSANTVVCAGDEIGFFASRRQPDVNPEPCIRCGWCVEGCPTRIHPAGLLEAAQQEDDAMADRYGVQSCIECGVCSYVCPSHLPLLTSIRKLKAGRQ